MRRLTASISIAAASLVIAGSAAAQQAQASFGDIDTDGSGTLSYAELVAVFGLRGADGLIRRDADGDGALSLAEAVDATSETTNPDGTTTSGGDVDYEDADRGHGNDGRPGGGRGGAMAELTLTMHERPFEVPAGLFRIRELAPLDGVLGIYPAPRDGRTLNTTDAFPADVITFDADGRVLTLRIDQNGPQLDRVPAGDGMRYAAYLAGGTIQAMGFAHDTRLTGWRCIDPAP